MTGWPKSKLGNLLEIQNGFAFSSKQFGSEGMPLIRIRDIKNGTQTETRYSGDFDERYVVHSGDLLIGMDGEFACHQWKGEPALLNQRVCRLEQFSEKLFPRFLLYGINKYLKDIEDVTAFATVKHLSGKQIAAIEFPTPPLSEQQRIVGILDQAFEGIAKAKANAERNLANAKELYRSEFSSILRDAKGWKEVTLPAISKNLDGKRIPITRSGRVAGEIPYYGASGIVDYVEGFIFDDDILLVSEDGANLLARSTPIAFPVQGKCWVNNHAHVLKFEVMVVQRYVERYINHISIERFVTGAAQPKLTQASLNKIPILMPADITETANIAERLDELSELALSLQANAKIKVKHLESLQGSILHQAFSGNL